MNKEVEEKTLETFMQSYNNLHITDLDKVNVEIDKILLFISSMGVEPKFVLNRALYKNENGIFEKGKFVIRPSIDYLIDGCDKNKYSFIIVNDSKFFFNFIENIVNWIYKYSIDLQLYNNLDRLNKFIFEILKEMNFPYKITFGIGNDIIDIDNDGIVLGIENDILLNIDKLPFFSDDLYWKNSYIGELKNALKECNRPYDIVKIKSKFTYDMGIYNRCSIYRLLRKIIKRNIKYVRIGIGYLENSDYFGIIEKKAVTIEELNDLDLTNCIVEENTNKTKLEEKELKEKIVWKFKLNPFEKKTNLLFDIDLKDFIELCKEEIKE